MVMVVGCERERDQGRGIAQLSFTGQSFFQEAKMLTIGDHALSFVASYGRNQGMQ